MKPQELIGKLNALGFSLKAEGGNLKLGEPSGVSLPPELAAAIRKHKPEILQYLTKQTTELIGCGHVDSNAWRLNQAGSRWVCGICHPPARDNVVFASGCVITYSNGVRIIPGSLTWGQAGELLEKAQRESQKEAMAIS